jgi:predicted PurR-regulated permease PerM
MNHTLASVISIFIFSLVLYFTCSKLKFDYWLDKSNARRITAIFLTFFIFVGVVGGINEAHITGIYYAIGQGIAYSQFFIVISFVTSKKSRMKA